MISAEVLEHSISEYSVEAITMRIILPRIILAEFNTHKRLSKNTSSSRAIPILKMIKHVYDNMFFPVYWGANQPGMQAKQELTGIRLKLAKLAWRSAGVTATLFARTLNKIGVHKQITNRLIENFSYITVIFSTTDLLNFLALRNHPDAQPEIHALAEAIDQAWKSSTPKLLKYGEWHLPLVTETEKRCLTIEKQRLISAARCASTSFQTVDGKDIDSVVALSIANKLTNSNPIHASPFEHQLTPDRLIDIDYRISGSKQKYKTAKVWEQPHLHGNTTGFIQFRKMIPNESKHEDHYYHLTFD